MREQTAVLPVSWVQRYGFDLNKDVVILEFRYWHLLQLGLAILHGLDCFHLIWGHV